MKAKTFDQKLDEDKSDIIGAGDLSRIKCPNQDQKRVNVDVPFWMIDSLDRKASLANQLSKYGWQSASSNQLSRSKRSKRWLLKCGPHLD